MVRININILGLSELKWMGMGEFNSDDYQGFHGGSDSKESTCNVGDLGLIPGLGRSPGEGKGYPLQATQYSGLENSVDYFAAFTFRRDPGVQ